jgi:hypothetical protein
MTPTSSEGQASIELVAGAVLTLLAGLIAFQLLAAGYGAVMSGHAAEAAALAIANGRDAEQAARSAVPGWPQSKLEVERRGAQVRVELITPSPFAFLRRRLVITSESAVRAPRTSHGS